MHDQALAEQGPEEEDKLECGLCGCVWEDPKRIEGRRETYYCDPDQSGCGRLTMPKPHTEAEQRMFDRWMARDAQEAKVLWSFSISQRRHCEIREDAIYHVHRTQDGGYIETPAIAMPCSIERVVRVEGTIRLDLHGPERISGTYDEIYSQLKKSGWILDPKHGQVVMPMLAQEARTRLGIKEGRETLEVFADDQGRLTFPVQAFPKPGSQAEEWERLEKLLEHTADPDEWQAYADLETFYDPKEILPAKALAAAAPFARLLRSKRFIVPSPFHVSTNSGSGKSKAAEAFSTHAWGTKDIPATDLNSDFRFAYYLSGAGTTLAVQEAERFDWARQAATIKNSLESDTVASRGTKDLSMVSYPSRRVLIFTSNHLPALGGPTLARLLVVRFREDRAQVAPEQQVAFDEAMGRLGPVGPSLVRAAVRRWKTPDELFEAVREHAEDIEKAYGARFRDNRRARCWGLIYAFLEVWQDASSGIHVVPPVHEFVEDVVRPIELDTFAAQQDRLEVFRGWFDKYRAERSRPTLEGIAVQGHGEIWDPHEWRSERTRRAYYGFLVTRSLLDAYNRDQRADPALRVESLAELARLVSESYPVPHEELVDRAKAVPRPYSFSLGSKRRAVWIPDLDPDDMHEHETSVLAFQKGSQQEGKHGTH